jgi:hypothetical protein
MKNTYTDEYIFKFGSLIQFGTSYFFPNFSTFAEEFLTNYNLYLPDIIENGYSEEWEMWQRNNSIAICDLYDKLNEADLIPKNPII